jgi:hypothetical protein
LTPMEWQFTRRKSITMKKSRVEFLHRLSVIDLQELLLF